MESCFTPSKSTPSTALSLPLVHSLSLSVSVSLAGTTISLLYGTSDVLLNLMNEFNLARFFSCFAVYTIQIHKQSTHTDTHTDTHTVTDTST